jgi:fructose-1,6-bisphosphatase/sedoheptulose 1,7-bisphosphatase-like protein
MPNAISVVALSDRGTMFDPGPCVYMEKLVVGPEAADAVDFEAPLALNLRLVAKAKRAQVGDLTVCILDRPRHQDLIGQIRQAGSRVKLITDGDVAGAIMAAREGTGVDMLVGIGGTPEAVIAACALKCLDGAMFGRLWPRNDDERRPPWTPATTSTRSSTSTTWSAATTCSSPPPASPTASSCAASASTARAPSPSRCRCAPSPAPPARSTPATSSPN